jgi:hypothetical protein
MSSLSNSDNTLPISIPEYYALNRSVSGFDRTHNVQITSIAEFPFGKGKKFLGGKGPLPAVVSNWQVSNLLSFMSGEPFSVGASSASLNAPGNSQRAGQVKSEVALLGGRGPGRPYFDPTAFAPVNEARFGAAGFNSMRGPGIANWDIAVQRTFKFGERATMQFRMDSFNLTNTPKFDNPRATSSSSGFGEIVGAYSEREFRLGLRFGF